VDKGVCQIQDYILSRDKELPCRQCIFVMYKLASISHQRYYKKNMKCIEVRTSYKHRNHTKLKCTHHYTWLFLPLGDWKLFRPVQNSNSNRDSDLSSRIHHSRSSLPPPVGWRAGRQHHTSTCIQNHHRRALIHASWRSSPWYWSPARIMHSCRYRLLRLRWSHRLGVASA
jgi:hypothetical protein